MADVLCGVSMALNARSGCPRCSSSGVGTEIIRHHEDNSAKCATGRRGLKPNTWYRLEMVKAPATNPGEIGIHDDQHGPREYRLVGIDVAGEGRGEKKRFHQSTSLSDADVEHIRGIAGVRPQHLHAVFLMNWLTGLCLSLRSPKMRAPTGHTSTQAGCNPLVMR